MHFTVSSFSSLETDLISAQQGPSAPDKNASRNDKPQKQRKKKRKFFIVGLETFSAATPSETSRVVIHQKEIAPRDAGNYKFNSNFSFISFIFNLFLKSSIRLE